MTGSSVSSGRVDTATEVAGAVPFTNGRVVSVVVALAAVELPPTGEKPGRLRGKHFARRGWESFCTEYGVVSFVKQIRAVRGREKGWGEGRGV